MSGAGGLVCVVGSLNEDTTLRVDALPDPGETLLVTGPRRVAPGGKGANQAAAAAVLGARVAMVGAVGDDGPGERAITALRGAGVEVSGILVRAGTGTGTGVAVVTVDAAGENTIVVDPGANATLGPGEVVDALEALAPDLVLLQLEVPVPTVRAAAEAAAGLGATVVLNPAPMPADPSEVAALLPWVDVLVPNRGELARLTGRPEPLDVPGSVAGLAALDHAGDVVVTLGADGAVCLARGAEPVLVPGVAVDAVDTSGAGDVFCAGLAHGLAAGVPLAEAVDRANRAAADSTTRHGARLELPGPGGGR